MIYNFFTKRFCQFSRLNVLSKAVLFLCLFSFCSIGTQAANGQTAGSCRTVVDGTGNLEFQECNNVKVWRLWPVTNGIVIINIPTNTNAIDQLWCFSPSGVFRIVSEDENMDATFALLMNAHEKERTLATIRLKPSPDPATTTAPNCEVDWVMSDL